MLAFKLIFTSTTMYGRGMTGPYSGTEPGAATEAVDEAADEDDDDDDDVSISVSIFSCDCDCELVQLGPMHT